MYLKIDSLKLIQSNPFMTYHDYLPLEIEFLNKLPIGDTNMYCLSLRWMDSIIEIFIDREYKILRSICFKMLRGLSVVSGVVPISNQNIFLTPIIDTSLIWDELLDDDYYLILDMEINIIKEENNLQFIWDKVYKTFNISEDVGVTLNDDNEVSSIILYNLKKENLEKILSFC